MYILSADDTWRLQGITTEVLTRWKAATGGAGVPMPTDANVRRVAGNAITAGTARFVARDLIIGRTLRWRDMLRQRPDLDASCVTAQVPDRGRRYGEVTAEALPPPTRDGDVWRGGGGHESQPRHARLPRHAKVSLLLGWMATLLALATLPGSVEGSRAGTLEDYALSASYEVLSSRFGRSFDPHALRHTAAGGVWPADVPPPRPTASRVQRWTPAYAVAIPKIVDYLSLGGLTLGTTKKYESAMNQWVLFTHRINTDGVEQFPVFLTGEDPSRDERHLLAFVAYQGWLMGNMPSTIRAKLTGLRWHHLEQGLKNPTTDKFRLASVLKSLKRIRGESTGKLPVTPAQLRHIKSKLDFSNPRHVVAWAGITLGFFLCMRCSEYLAEGYVFDPVRALTTDKVRAHFGDALLPDDQFEYADSLTVLFEISKTDQNRIGCTRTVYESHDDLCPVRAYQALRRMRGASWTPGEPAMADTTGWTMNREVMSTILKASAMDMGHEGAEFATHSLRIGGATTMAATGLYSDDEIRRFGRWRSDCWKRYVYAARSAVRGLAAAMSRVHVVTEDVAQRLMAPAAAA